MVAATDAASLERRSNVRVRPMTQADLRSVVDVHFEVFPGYFLTRMGRRFTLLYYAQYLTHHRAYALVAEVDGSVVGFIVGGRDVGDLERRFYRRNFATLASIIAYRFVTDPVARASILARAPVVRRATRTVLRPKRAAEREAIKRARKPARRPTASVLSVGVRERHRGLGLGRMLLERFVDLARDDGAHVVKDTVQRDNVEQLARKVRAGWREIHADEHRVSFALEIVPAPTEPELAVGGDDLKFTP